MSQIMGKVFGIGIWGFVVVASVLLGQRLYERAMEPAVDARIAFEVKLWRLDIEHRYSDVPVLRAYNSLRRIELAPLDSGTYCAVNFEENMVQLSDRLLLGGPNEAGKASLRTFLYQAMSRYCYGMDEKSCRMMNPRHGGEYYYTLERAALYNEWATALRSLHAMPSVN